MKSVQFERSFFGFFLFFFQYLKEAGWAEGGRVIACTQPRRLAVQVSVFVLDPLFFTKLLSIISNFLQVQAINTLKYCHLSIPGSIISSVICILLFLTLKFVPKF